MLHVTLLLFLICANADQITIFDKEETIKKFSYKGKETLTNFEEYSDKCWINALKDLRSQCSTFAANDEAKTRLTFAIANCFFSNTGHKTYSCDKSKPVKACISKMSSEAYGIFSAFYLQADNICYYLQEKLFHETTEEAINGLYEATATTATDVKQINTKSQEVYEMVGKTQSTLEKGLSVFIQYFTTIGTMIEKTINLSKDAKESISTVLTKQNNLEKTITGIAGLSDKALEQTNKIILQHEQIAYEQEKLMEGSKAISKVLDRVTWFQQIILGEVLDIKSLVFYIITSFLVFVLTSFERTHNARILLVGFLILSFFAERYASFVLMKMQSDYLSGDNVSFVYKILSRLFQTNSQQLMYKQSSHFIRKAFLILCFVTLSLFAYFHKNIANCNNKLLTIIDQRMTMLIKDFNGFTEKINIRRDFSVSDDNEDDDIEPYCVIRGPQFFNTPILSPMLCWRWTDKEIDCEDDEDYVCETGVEDESSDYDEICDYNYDSD